MSFTEHHPSAGRETRWLTPSPLVKSLGEFDLDPCGAPNHNLAKHTYLLENGDDGLRDPWFGRVWLNPPYGKQAEPFMRRLVEHGRGTALIFARTETKLWHSLIWPNATSILFMSGRITFLTPDLAKAPANSGAPSVLVAFGEEDSDALRDSGLAGFFVYLRDPKNKVCP